MSIYNHRDIDVSKNTLTPPPLECPSQLTFLFKPNATMNYHGNQ